jgi:hypothetical protein
VIRLRTHLWAIWTAARASYAYVAGHISADEWHTRIGIARVAIGRDEVSVDEAAGRKTGA